MLLMGVSITIRDVPQEARDELAARAARSGRSLQEYLRSELIAMTGKPDMKTWLEEVRAFKRETGVSVTSEQILESIRAGRPD
jgi:antitoxin FitA